MEEDFGGLVGQERYRCTPEPEMGRGNPLPTGGAAGSGTVTNGVGCGLSLIHI